MLRYLYLFLLLTLMALRVVAQTEDDLIIEQLIESLSEELGDDFDYAELTEKLQYYHAHPINLNETDGTALLELRFLSPLQVEQILEHRKLSGNFIAVYELQAVEGLDGPAIRFLLPFVEIRPIDEKRTLGNFVDEGTHDVLFRYAQGLERQQGYLITDTNRSRYLGSPDRLYLRYRYQYKQSLSVAVNMKKDAGEQFFKGAQSAGFDFYSANIALSPKGAWKKIVAGDYALQFGQGIGLWSGLGFGKGALIQNIARQGLGLRPYTSSNEFSFFRGIAATYQWKKLWLTPFVSYKKLTATETDENLRQFRTISQTGLHRTPSEIANKGTLGELLYGLNLEYRPDRFTIGLTAYQSQLDGELIPRETYYNQYVFRGNRLANISGYYHYYLKSLYFFGEVAHRVTAGTAFLTGLIVPLSSSISLALLYRDYQPDYFSFYSAAFAEGSITSNEKGVYGGVIFQPNKQWQWINYLDYFQFPWLKYRVDAPSAGYDFLSQLVYTPNKSTSLKLRYRYRNKQENGTAAVVSFIRQQGQLSFQSALNRILTLRNRLEVSYYQKEEETSWGCLFFQDFLIKPPRSRFSGNARIAWFRTAGYHARIYALESDVLYAYSMPFYSDRGWRYYINLRWKLARRLDFWGRYAAFIYTNLDQLGSGLNQIEGNRKSELKLEIRLQF